MDKKIIAGLVIILIILVFWFIKRSKDGETKTAKDVKVDKKELPLSQEEINQGWYYWGDRSSKREGTPDDWIYSLEGTRSARWSAPSRQKISNSSK